MLLVDTWYGRHHPAIQLASQSAGGTTNDDDDDDPLQSSLIRTTFLIPTASDRVGRVPAADWLPGSGRSERIYPFQRTRTQTHIRRAQKDDDVDNGDGDEAKKDRSKFYGIQSSAQQPEVHNHTYIHIHAQQMRPPRSKDTFTYDDDVDDRQRAGCLYSSTSLQQQQGWRNENKKENYEK